MNNNQAKKEIIMFNLEDFKKYGVAIRRDGKRVSFSAHIPRAACADMRVLSMDDDGVLWFTSEDGISTGRTSECE